MPLKDGDLSTSSIEGDSGVYQDSVGFAAPSSSTAPILSPTANETFGRVVAYGIPAIGAGLVDTLGQSFGLFHNNTVPDALKAFTGDGENSFGDFYARNQPVARAGGEIAGMFLPGLAAMKVLKTVKGLREAGSLGAELASGTSWANKSLDILLGNSADMAAKEAAISAATKAGAANQGVWAGRTLNIPAVIAAKKSYYAARAIDATRTTIAFELGSRAAFNSSDTFYPADYTITDQIKWAGAGLGVGVGLEMAMAKYAVRGMMQTALKVASKERDETATALSPFAKDADKVIFRPAERGVGVTLYAAMKSDLKNTLALQGNSVLNTNVSQDITNVDRVIGKQIDHMGWDISPFIPRVAIDDERRALAMKALDYNNTMLMYATKIGDLPESGAKDFYEKVHKGLEKAQTEYSTAMYSASVIPDPVKMAEANKKALNALIPIEEAANELHYVIEPDGKRWTVYKNRADNWLDHNDFKSIKRDRYPSPAVRNGQEVTIYNSKLTATGTNKIVLHDNFRAELPPTPTPKDFSALYAMGSKLIKEYREVEGQEFVLTPALNWRTSEMTVALAEAKPGVKQAIKLGPEFASINDVKFHVLNEKVKEFMKLMPDTSTPSLPVKGLAARIAGNKANFTPAQVIQRLNLPEAVGSEPQPVIEMIAHMKLQGMTDLNEMFPLPKGSLTPVDYSQYDLLQAHLRETAGILDPKKEVPIQGVLLKQALGDGAFATAPKPLFVAATSAPYLTRPDAVISGRVQAMRDVQLERLAQITPAMSPVISSILGKIVTQGIEGGDLNGAANTARAVQTLQDGLVSGTGQVVYADRINEQFPTLKALQLVAQSGDKFIDNYVANLAKVQVTPLYAATIAPKNRADLIDFNRLEQAYRHGWDITNLEKNPNGAGYVFRLNTESKVNTQLSEYHFPGEGMAEEGGGMAFEFLPDMSVTAKKNGYTPLVVSKAAGDLAKAISDMSIQSGIENNALRVALGHSPITIRDFHLPTPELSKEGTYFVKNSATDRVVATYSNPGNFKENRDRAQAAADLLSKEHGSLHVALPLETIQAQHQINDDAFFSLIDYSDQIKKSGAGIKGGLAHTEIDTSDFTLRSMLRSLQQQYLNIGIRARAAVFEPELNYARQASQTAAAQGSNSKLGGGNIFDRYIATMFSQSPNIGKGAIGRAYGAVETTMDNALSWANAHFTELTGSESAKAGAIAMRKVLRQQSSAEEFAQYAKTMPSWSPFHEANEWAESTFKQKMPWTTRPIAAELSKLSSTMSLRLLDVGTAINNFAGLMTNSPSVVMALRQLQHENTEQWINRTAAWGTQIADGVVTFSPMKAMATSVKSLFNGELNKAMQDAAKHGYFEPEYASLAKALSTPQTPGMSALHNFSQKASYAADKSEILSRQWAWGMGYKIGKDLHGFKDENNAYIFANNFVNDMIGNYSPNNKPAMFQGALGLPLGAFQTYMFNFYRRMYGMIERGDKAALMAQYAAQSSIFGAKSVPGYSAWNSLFQSNDVGSDDFGGRINRKFSGTIRDLLMNGTLSNIPKIFGTDGLAFYSRGSVDMTQSFPTILDMSRAPPAQFLMNTAKGVHATVNNILGAGGFSLQQQEEIMANFSTNRALKSIMEMAANAKTTQQGNVVIKGTQDAIHVAAAMLGTQTETTRNVMDATNKERLVQLQQEDLRATLDQKTKAIFRSGEITVPQLQGIVSAYINAGGNKAYLGQWFRNSFMTAQTPVITKKLEELGHSGKMLEFQDMLSVMQENQPPRK